MSWLTTTARKSVSIVCKRGTLCSVIKKASLEIEGLANFVRTAAVSDIKELIRIKLFGNGCFERKYASTPKIISKNLYELSPPSAKIKIQRTIDSMNIPHV